MRNCPYIEFESLKLSGNGSKYGPMSATVWRREKLSASLGMTEDQLVEWTILIGNDYTKSLYTTTVSPYTLTGLKAFARLLMMMALCCHLINKVSLYVQKLSIR